MFWYRRSRFLSIRIFLVKHIIFSLFHLRNLEYLLKLQVKLKRIDIKHMFHTRILFIIINEKTKHTHILSHKDWLNHSCRIKNQILTQKPLGRVCAWHVLSSKNYVCGHNRIMMVTSFQISLSSYTLSEIYLNKFNGIEIRIPSLICVRTLLIFSGFLRILKHTNKCTFWQWNVHNA